MGFKNRPTSRQLEDNTLTNPYQTNLDERQDFLPKLNVKFNSELLAKGAGRALGCIINKIHRLKDFIRKTIQ